MDVYCRFVSMKNFFLFLFASAIIISATSCKKDSFITSPDARLRISEDSLKFDTVFTTTGSITKSFKIVNENDQRLRLSSVKLMGGNSGAFKMNVNGMPGSALTNLDIAANDSIYVFVSVFVNPSAANLPFIISDSIFIEYNNTVRFVQLQAYGQNAHFFTNQFINTSTAWPNDLPYVILGSLQVNANVTLALSPGVKIYVHADAPILIDGTLLTNGTAASPIVFTGDRLDEPYKNFPASWPGIYFRSNSKNNLMRFTNVKNAFQAIGVSGPSVNANPKLVLQQCIIDNAYNAGIFCSNTSISATNTLVSNCANNINIELGGSYTFTHCTVASYSTNFILHKTPVLNVSNFAIQNGSSVTGNLQADFTNCIFWGDNGFVENEVLVNKQGTNVFNVNFKNSLYKATTDPANSTLSAVIKNQNPFFDSIDVVNRYYDFRHTLNSFAPGINKGSASTVTTDLDNKPRPVGLPDMGSYEKQ